MTVISVASVATSFLSNGVRFVLWDCSPVFSMRPWASDFPIFHDTGLPQFPPSLWFANKCYKNLFTVSWKWQYTSENVGVNLGRNSAIGGNFGITPFRIAQEFKAQFIHFLQPHQFLLRYLGVKCIHKKPCFLCLWSFLVLW